MHRRQKPKSAADRMQPDFMRFAYWVALAELAATQTCDMEPNRELIRARRAVQLSAAALVALQSTLTVISMTDRPDDLTHCRGINFPPLLFSSTANMSVLLSAEYGLGPENADR